MVLSNASRNARVGCVMRIFLWIAFAALALTTGCDCTSDTAGNVGGEPDGAPQECMIGAAGGVCEDRACRLEVPAGALGEARLLTVNQHLPNEDVRADTVAQRMCLIGPSNVQFSKPATLKIALTEDEIPEGFSASFLEAFRYDGEATLLAEADVDYVDLERLEVLVREAMDVGITVFPHRVSPGIELGVEVFDVSDAVSYIRNLSSQLFLGSYHDGTRFYLTNGGRILIWNNGVPSDPTQPPDVILGKPDLVTQFSDPSASNITRAQHVWSDGSKLVVTANNRVLIWNQVPTSNFTPADIVLGQNSFTSTRANGGGEPSATTMFAPDAIASDGATLLISDALNNRVLVWDSFPVLNNQPATHVIGQQDLQSNAIRGGAIPMQQPRGVYWDGERVVVTSVFTCTCAEVLDGFPSNDNASADRTIGVPGIARVAPNAFSLPGAMSGFGESGFAMRDHRGGRISLWSSFPEEASTIPDFFIGKPDGFLGGTSLGGITSSTLSSKKTSAGVFANEDLLVVPDGRRVLIWNELPSSSYTPADLVIGQPTATTAIERVDYRGLQTNTLAHPSGLSAAKGVLAVADRSNNRVLLMDAASPDAASAVVVGQANGESYVPNGDWNTPTASSLSGPDAVFTDGTRLVVADTGNNRVLIWNSIPTTSGTAADVVVGQPDFQSVAPNAGSTDADGDGDSDASEESLHRPSGAWISGTALYVADTVNHRVLVYDPIPTANGASASTVLGQADMQSNEPNAGTTWFTPSATGFAFPAALTVLDSGELLVADKENNRVVGFAPPFLSGAAASLVLGQPDFVSNQDPNYKSTIGQPGLELSDSALVAGQNTLRRPSGFATANGQLFVADSGNQRVLGFGLPLVTNAPNAELVLGQPDFETRGANTNGVGAHSLEAPAAVAAIAGRLFVADTANHRLLGYDTTSLNTGVVATTVFGQVDMLGNGVNASSDSRGVLKRPGGTSWDGAQLWVADRDNHRVLVFDATEEASDTPVLVLGQTDLGRDLPNGGLDSGATTMLEPADVFSDGEVVVVADRSNNRVLIWNSLPAANGQPADVVLGQADFQAASPNRGNGVLNAGADTMFAPEGVFLRDNTLYVSDTGNNRVLVFDTLPTVSGAAADRVLCQNSMTSNLGNRGGSVPDADTCAWPTGLHLIDGQLYVADTLNNRVLAFASSSQNGEAAILVVGQPDFQSRSPVASNGSPDARVMSGPTDVGYDGFNLAVSDGGNNRVLLYTQLPTEDGQEANAVLGQSSFTTNITGPDYTSLDQPISVTLIPGPFHSTRAVIADSGKDRLLFFESLARRE